MASSSKKPKEENKKEKSNSTAVKKSTKAPEKKAITPKKPVKTPEKKASTPKKPIKKPEKKASTPTKPDRSKPKSESKPDRSKNKSKSENKADKNGTPNNKRKRKEEENVEGGEEEEEAKVCYFPVNRIKRIIKSEDSRIAVSQDVVFVVNKATEMFLEKFCEDGYKCAIKDRKKSLSYKHISTVVHDRKRYDFLSDYVPLKIKAEDALKEMNSTETGEG